VLQLMSTLPLKLWRVRWAGNLWPIAIAAAWKCTKTGRNWPAAA